MQQQAIDVSQTAFEKFSIEKDIAQYIKKEVYTTIISDDVGPGTAGLTRRSSSSTCGLEQHGIALSAGILEALLHMVRLYGLNTRQR